LSFDRKDIEVYFGVRITVLYFYGVFLKSGSPIYNSFRYNTSHIVVFQKLTISLPKKMLTCTRSAFVFGLHAVINLCFYMLSDSLFPF